MRTEEKKKEDMNGDLKEDKEMVVRSPKKIASTEQVVNTELSGTIATMSLDQPKFNEKRSVVILGIILTLIGTIATPVVLAWLGWAFNTNQTEIARNRQLDDTKVANARQDADNLAKERETREQVLTDYSNSISQLVTEEDLGQTDNPYVENIARGQTLIALRRLNPGDEPKDSNTSQDDAGELKGLLIRYLYDTKLIGYDPNFVPGGEGDDGEDVIDLYGANLTKVVLEDAWLPGIDLTKAEYNGGNFKNANLTNAKLYQANFTDADFTGANLKGANFENANLTNANFTDVQNFEPEKIRQACYWEKATYTSEQQQELAAAPTTPPNDYCSERWSDQEQSI